VVSANTDTTGRWGDPTGTIIDAHNDLTLELVHRRGEREPFRQHWLEQLERGGVALQVCPLYVWWDHIGDRALRSGLEEIVALKRAVAENPEIVEIRSLGDLERAIAEDQLGLMISMEGAEILGSDPSMLDIFHALGLRMVSLTHFQRNAYADGNGEPSFGGLSALGRELVDRIERLGIMLDLAHASDQTFAEVVQNTESTTLLVSHSGCRALFDRPRNTSDDQMRELAARGGVIGIFAVPYFLGEPRTSIDRVVDHILHALEVAGPEHVGLGGDFTAQLTACPGLVRHAPWLGIDPAMAAETVDGLGGPSGYPRLVEAMQRRGITGDTLAAVLHGNFLQLFRAALPVEP
jgi:membrane dipeptidase